MLIIIEGTDASGKTTLASEIQREIVISNPSASTLTLHKGKPSQPTRLGVLDDYVLSTERDRHITSVASSFSISDRWHWGEATYAPLKRPETNKDGFGLLGVAGWRWTELYLASRGASQFWLYQELEVIQKRLAERGDDYIEVHELEKILELYTNTAEQAINLEKLEPGEDSINQVTELAKYVIGRAKHIWWETEKIRSFPTYIGVPLPEVLLVGDARRLDEKDVSQLPFTPLVDSDGEFLLEALPDDAWKKIGIVNINDYNFGTYNFIELWTALGRPNIVSLGKYASDAIEIYDIPPKKISRTFSPGSVKRLLSDRKDDYGTAIIGLAADTISEESRLEWELD